jgi:hypothetical protein
LQGPKQMRKIMTLFYESPSHLISINYNVSVIFKLYNFLYHLMQINLNEFFPPMLDYINFG